MNKTSGKRLLKQITKHFELPIPPQYSVSEGEREVGGDLSLVGFECPAVAGYWSSNSDKGVGVAIRKNGVTVMSCTPMEIESHLIPQSSANGRVVIAGLGLAMITCSVLRKKSVKSVIVLDNDQNVIDLYPSILSGADKRLWEESIEQGRLRVINADCTKPLKDETKQAIGKVDYLWCDIWNNLGSKDGYRITKSLCDQLKPKLCDWWGWELELAINAVQFNIHSGAKVKHSISAKCLRAIKSKLQVPLTIYSIDSDKLKVLVTIAFMASQNTLIQEKSRHKRQSDLLMVN